MNYFHLEETTKQKLNTILIIIMLIILAVEIKVLYDLRHPPTTAPADMVYQFAPAEISGAGEPQGGRDLPE